MKKIILGVHGLGNKPPEELLEEWWRESINEGLRRIGKPHLDFNFEIVYWSNLLHPVPLDPKESNKDSELYLEEKYQPANTGKKKNKRTLKELFLNFFNRQRDKIFFNESIHLKFPSLTDLIIKHFFKDLDIYFTRECTEENKSDCLAKDLIHQKLFDAINRYKDRDILIIAHSMGSIVLYEVLMRLAKDLDMRTLVTIGSPLGVPFILQKLKDDLNSVVTDENELYTPDCIIDNWINLADVDDKLAQSADLGKMFKPNKQGVKPEMFIVDNDYDSEGIENPHKSYGYLRTPELANIVDNFLSRGRNKFILWLGRKFELIRHKFINL
ncbi:hypothetical protein ACFLSS_03560 [Bacteroidota bacterium]